MVYFFSKMGFFIFYYILLIILYTLSRKENATKQIPEYQYLQTKQKIINSDQSENSLLFVGNRGEMFYTRNLNNCTSCLVCYKPTTKRCSRCKKAKYCSREHQISDWKSKHKRECPLQNNRVIKIPDCSNQPYQTE